MWSDNDNCHGSWLQLAGVLRATSRCLAWLWLAIALGGLPVLLGVIFASLPLGAFAPAAVGWLILISAILLMITVPGVLLLDALGQQADGHQNMGRPGQSQDPVLSTLHCEQVPGARG